MPGISNTNVASLEWADLPEVTQYYSLYYMYVHTWKLISGIMTSPLILVERLYSVYCIDIVLAIEEEQILYRKEGKGRRCCLENGTSWFAPCRMI